MVGFYFDHLSMNLFLCYYLFCRDRKRDIIRCWIWRSQRDAEALQSLLLAVC